MLFLNKKIIHGLTFLSLVLSLSACSTAAKNKVTQNTAEKSAKASGVETTSENKEIKNNGVAYDRFEHLNRKIYRANIAIDNVLLKPVAKVYNRFTPQIIDDSITNIFANFDDVGNAINNLLQLKVGDSLKDTERVIFNSSFGIAGIFDIATEMGLPKHHEDFGQTLARWGVPAGPYIMLPFLGPSTLRDATAKLTVDQLTKPEAYSKYPYQLLVVDKLDQRADLLSAEEVLKVFSDDQYSVLRDAWLQRRMSLIRDGKADKKADDDMIDALEDMDSE